MGTRLSKVPGMQPQAGSVGPTTTVAMDIFDARRNSGLTRTRKAATDPLTVDRMASEVYPAPPPLHLDPYTVGVATRTIGR